MIFVGMSSLVVHSLGVFPDSPIIDTSDAQGNFTTTSIQSNIFMAGTAITVVLTTFSLLTRQTVFVGLTLFGGIFWTSWTSINGLFYTGGFMRNETGILIIAMLWLGMAAMFIGAIIGMLSGNPWMK